MKINLFDNNNPAHNKSFNIYWPSPDIEYIRPGLMEFDGISLFTDEMAFDPIVDQVKSKYKVAWALESPMVKPHIYQHSYQIEDKFDYIYSCWPEYTAGKSLYPWKYKQCYFGACWIVPENCDIYPKTKMLSIVASNKTWLPGHRLRHEIIKLGLHPELETWGSGYQYFTDSPEDRLKPFRDYRYIIVAENCRFPGYFTDKILDCFATGAIPIYWGNPQINKLFDNRGFYQFNDLNELKQILGNISEEDYLSKGPYIYKNFHLMKEFASPDKWLYENCFSKLL